MSETSSTSFHEDIEKPQVDNADGVFADDGALHDNGKDVAVQAKYHRSVAADWQNPDKWHSMLDNINNGRKSDLPVEDHARFRAEESEDIARRIEELVLSGQGAYLRLTA